MFRILCLVGVGGLIGSVGRYLLSTYISKVFPSAFPYGTFAINIIGCLLIGMIYGYSERYAWFNSEWRLFLATGVCGGFTTFSAFSYENMKLLQDGNYLVFAAYSIGSFALGLLAVFAGMAIAKL